jgi:4'-phosphopantetheinyl transferase
MANGDYLWRHPLHRLTIAAGEVHIWRASLDLPDEVLFGLRSTLSAEERERASRFYFEKDRVQFTAAHGILRDILGRYSGIAPAELQFHAGSHGKPALVGTGAEGSAVESSATAGSIEFNMSHSRWMALYAVSLKTPVGVDIEWVREDIEWQKIAERFFHPDETAHLGELPEPEQRKGFFQFWTCKEAYIKGRGKGLSIPTRSFAVRLAPGGATVIGHVDADADRAGVTAKSSMVVPDGDSMIESTARWSLFTLDPAPVYAGAVAAAGGAGRLVHWEWMATDRV